MDEVLALKYRLISLESLVLKQDKLLRIVCTKLDNSKTDPQILAACKEYIKVFPEDNYSKKV